MRCCMGGIRACSYDASDKRSETVMISGMTDNPPTHPVRDRSISTDGLTDEQAKTGSPGIDVGEFGGWVAVKVLVVAGIRDTQAELGDAHGLRL